MCILAFRTQTHRPVTSYYKHLAVWSSKPLTYSQNKSIVLCASRMSNCVAPYPASTTKQASKTALDPTVLAQAVSSSSRYTPSP